ncbi:MAG: UDP-N-acetylmuramoyl-L-alanine--D-glutamate ligase [Anaerolineaceae bacterium]
MNQWSGRDVLIIGAARQGHALARYLSKKGARVILNDKRSMSELSDVNDSFSDTTVECVFGSHPLDLLDRVKLVCLSGGIPLTLPIVQEAAKRSIPLTNDSQIFMETIKAPVIGITGSAGKTTTTTLVGRMAKAAETKSQQSWVGGNIGQPLVEYLDEIGSNDIVVLELSSFQLEQMTVSPHIAAILNITPNHLDRHGSMANYTNAKAHILNYQTSDDLAILNREDPGSWGLRSEVQGKVISFGLKRPLPGQVGTYFDGKNLMLQSGNVVEILMPRETIRLRGEHNIINVLAACAIAYAAGFPTSAMISGVDGFMGVEHRLELVRTWRGTQWYNSSIASAPERTMADLRSFTEPIILLLGGRDKDLPWEDLARMVHNRVDHVIVFGEASFKIIAALGLLTPGERLTSIACASDFENALYQAAQISESGDIVLLSPGCTSYDAFQDFEERGNYFKKWVNNLP